MIMSQIEPELMTASLETLAERFGNENPEQARARKERYERAFAEYTKRFQEFTVHLQNVVHEYKRVAIATAEAQARKSDARDLSNLESSMNSL